MRQLTRYFLLAALALGLAGTVLAQDLASFEKRITLKKLDNGLTVIILDRPEAPVFSFFTHVNAGAAQEKLGITGLAHMGEHMAFKGSENIGTTDYPAEKKALARVEEAYQAYDRARRAQNPDAAKVAQLDKEWKAAIDAAQKYVVPNEFAKIVDRAGGVGMNAFTNSDETGYFYSLPSNQVELWAYLESERFLHPVMREFYKERDVVTEERRMRTESQPIGRLIEQFLGVAFIAHPYGRPVVGFSSDLHAFSATDAKAFFDEYYVPANMVVALVGDVKAADVMPVITKYFGRLPDKEAPAPLRTVEPKQTAEREVFLTEKTQPFYVEGYHKGSATSPDAAVYTVIQDLMSNGRTSRLYRSLVRDKKIAAVAAGFSGFPGEKYPNLFAFFAVPTPGHAPEEMGKAIHEEIERLKTEDVPADELQAVKTRAKANLIRQLDSNQGLAIQLATAQALYGDWRELFRQVDQIDAVTAQDIRRVASDVFVPSNRTVGEIQSTQMAGAPAKGGSE